jgi:hypothetical protein
VADLRGRWLTPRRLTCCNAPQNYVARAIGSVLFPISRIVGFYIWLTIRAAHRCSKSPRSTYQAGPLYS